MSTLSPLAPDKWSTDEQVSWARRALLADPVASEHGPDGRRPAEVLIEFVDRLGAMLEHTTEMITVLDADGNIRYSNRAAGLLTGHSEEINGNDPTALIHPDDRERALAALAHSMETDGGIADAEFRLRFADGSWHHVDAHVQNCLADPVAGVVVSMRDVCTRKAGEAALVSANEAMHDFVTVASHELRTPTSIINGFASGLVRNWDRMTEADRRESVEAIARSSRRLTGLVEDLLVLTALDGGAEEPSRGPSELGPTVRDVIDELGATDIAVVVPDHLSVAAGTMEIGRVLRNYIENAVRYGAAPIRVEATEDDRFVVVRVVDNGEGIDPRFAPHLFERFARADPSRSRQTGGTGLGLSIVHALAKGWGGSAWFEPGQPGGACFAVRIPIAVSHP